MAQEYSRTRRVADQVQRELAQIIQQDLKDPRVGMVTITAVEVSREFEHAKVFITVFGDQSQIDKTLEGLNKAAGFLRRELARRLSLRTTPKLHFSYDASLANGAKLSALINKAVSMENSGPEDDSAADSQTDNATDSAEGDFSDKTGPDANGSS